MEKESIQMIFAIVMFVMSLIMTVGVTAIFSLMRGKRDSDHEQREEDREKFKELKEKDEKLSAELNDFKERMPHQFVLRDDFIRILTSFDHKLDAQVETLNKIQATMREKS